MKHSPRCAVRKLALATAVFAATFGGLGTTTAQVYPFKAITLVVPFAAGGPTDALARLLGQRMSEVIKQPIIIENVGGAGSMLGTARAAKAPPDGYTILINDLALPSAPYLRKSLP